MINLCFFEGGVGSLNEMVYYLLVFAKVFLFLLVHVWLILALVHGLLGTLARFRGFDCLT